MRITKANRTFNEWLTLLNVALVKSGDLSSTKHEAMSHYEAGESTDEAARDIMYRRSIRAKEMVEKLTGRS